MSNPIASALGTQRQFTKQPEAPYQKRLITPSFGSGISASIDNNALALARSLGLLGSGLIGESIAADKRAEMIGKAEADRIFSVSSEKDREKLSTLDILGQSGKFDIADNPYAVARIDELRGQHLNTLFKQEYENEVVPNQELPDNSQQNILNFETFMDKKLKDSGVKAYNRTAFEKGFYGSRPLDVLQQDANYRKRRQADFEADRDAAIVSKYDDLATKSINMSSEDFAKAAQELQTDNMLTCCNLTDRIKFLNNFAKQVVTNGNAEHIEAWGETVAYFKADGTEVKIKDVLPLGEYKEMAEKSGVYLNNQKAWDFFKSLENVPSVLIPEKFTELKAKDPLLWKAVAHTQDSMCNQRKKEEVAKLKEHQKLLIEGQKQTYAFTSMQSRYAAWSNGKSMGSDGYTTTSDKYTYVGKEYSYSERDINNFGQTLLAQIYNDASLTDVEKAEKALHALSYPPFKKTYLKAMEAQYSDVLGGLHKNSEKLNEAGNKMLNMYRVDPAMFKSLFSDDLVRNVELLNTLVKNNNDSISDAANDYQAVKNTQADSERMRSFKSDYTGTDSFVEVESLGGEGSTKSINVTDGANPAIAKAHYNAYLVARAAGMNLEDAMTKAKQTVASYYMEYDGCAINKAFTYNIQSDRKEVEAKAFLDMQKAQGADHFMFDGNDELIVYRGTKVLAVYSTATFADAVNNWIITRIEEPKVEEGFIDKVLGLFKGDNKQQVKVNDVYNPLDPSAGIEHMLDNAR